MYLPLTGYKIKDRLEEKMKVSSTNSAHQGQPASRAQQVGQDQNKIEQDKKITNEQKQQDHVTSEKFKNHGSRSGMSTEDFIKLHNCNAENMAEAIKDVMALKALEKTLDVIEKIVSD